jgi:SAM-dependent methyltransferase
VASPSPYTQFHGEILSLVRVEFGSLGRRPKVLEAGGGSATSLKDAQHEFSFTTIDISPEQLARNAYAEEKILGDVGSFDYGARRFDLVVCYDLLEHLKQPERAFARLTSVLNPGGLMIIKGPVPQSMQGLVTSLSPHWFHVWFYRWVLKSRTAGQPGYAPFRSEHARGARPDVIRDALRSNGLEEVRYIEFSTHSVRLRQRYPVLFAGFWLGAKAVSGLTRKRYGGLASDFVLVLRRPRERASVADAVLVGNEAS